MENKDAEMTIRAITAMGWKEGVPAYSVIKTSSSLLFICQIYGETMKAILTAQYQLSWEN